MAELRIGVANGGLTINGVSNMGTGGTGGAPVQVAPQAQAPTQSAGGAVAGAVEAAVAPAAQVPVQVPAQGAPVAPANQAPPPVAPAQPVSSAPSAGWQAPPTSNPANPVPAPLDPPSPLSQAAYAAPALAAGPPLPLLQPVLQETSPANTSLSSASAAAIAVPLTIVALAILVLAGLVFWYKRHQDRSSPLLRRRSTRRRRGEDEESYSSEKSIFASSPGFGRSGTTRGVTVTPHIESNILPRPEPSISPSIATSRRPTALSLSKPLPPISEYSCGSNSSAGEGSYTSVPVIHAATLGRRADAKYLQQQRYTAHPTIREEGSEMASETEDGASTLAPNSPVSISRISRSKGKSLYSSDRRSNRIINGHTSSPTKLKRNPASVYSTQTAPLPRRPLMPSTHSYARSLPTSFTRLPPARSEFSATNITAPSSPETTDSDSLPELVQELPADHPFAQTYTATATKLKSRSTTTKGSTSDVDGESMIRSITAQTELTLPWGFAEARKIRPIRQESRSEGAKLFREDTRKGEDWAREKLSS